MDKTSLSLLNKKIEKNSGFILDLKENISNVIVGQEDLINKILISVISNGHILLEGGPGLATLTVEPQENPCDCPADTNDNGFVNTDDLLIMVGNIFDILFTLSMNKAPEGGSSNILSKQLDELSFNLSASFMYITLLLLDK